MAIVVVLIAVCSVVVTAREVMDIGGDTKLLHVMQITSPYTMTRSTTEDNAILGKFWQTKDKVIMVLLPVVSKHIPPEKGFSKIGTNLESLSQIAEILFDFLNS